MITLCGVCGKEKCECGKIAALSEPIDDGWRGGPPLGHSSNCICALCVPAGYYHVQDPPKYRTWDCRTSLTQSPIILPDIGECAVYGQQKPATPDYETADKVLRKALGDK